MTARRLEVAEFPADSAGYVALHDWLAGFGVLDAVGVESTGAWGAGLARSLRTAGVAVIVTMGVVTVGGILLMLWMVGGK